MLEDLLKCNKVGSREEINFLLFHALSHENFKKIENVKTLCILHSYNFGSSFNGIISLLELLNLVDINNDLIKSSHLISQFDSETFFDHTIFFERLFSVLHDNNKLETFFNYQNTKVDIRTLDYYVKDSLIPFSLNVIKHSLINTGFFIKSKEVDTTFLINVQFRNFFSNFVVSKIKRIPLKKTMTLDQLKSRLELQDKYGNEAEEYVLQYELSRLVNHYSKQFIKRVSSDFVNIGYDIESFDSEESIVNDRFIEVKSFNEKVSFYWSKNEIAIAQELGERYYLYLIDRSKYLTDGYKPFIIKDAYKNVFLDSAWNKEIDSHYVSMID